MGIRESIRQKPVLAIAAGAALVVMGLGVAAFQMAASGAGGGTQPDKAYYSTDDGKSWFVDDANRFPPFDHGGKEAVRAYVFESSGKTFVNHLERYTAESHKKLEAFTEAMRAGKSVPPVAQITGMREIEVKKPGATDWVLAKNLAKSAPITHPVSPDGGSATPTPVTP